MRAGIGSAAALAILAGTVGAQQQQQRQYQQMGSQAGMQYRDTGEWRPVNQLRELSDSIVILKSENEDHEATVKILHGQVQAELNGQSVSPQQVEQRGERLRILDDEGKAVARFTLPDLQTVRQAQMLQPGMQDQQLEQRHFGIQDQWRDDSRQQEDRRFRERSGSQDDWRRDQQLRDEQFRTQQEYMDQQRRDRRSGDQQRFQDQQFRDSGMRDRSIGFQDQWQDQRFQREQMRGPVEQQLGVFVSPASQRDLGMTRHQQGLVITDVQPGSPLDNYGIRPGDVIVRVDGRPASYGQLQQKISRIDERDTLRMTLVRDGREGTFNVRGNEIVDRPRMDRFDRQDDRGIFGAPETTMRPQAIGLQVHPAQRSELQRTPAGARYDSGIHVTQVHRGSPADRAGFRTGDVIVEIAGQPNVSTDDLRQELAMVRPGERVPMKVIRDGRVRNINLRTTDGEIFGIGEERFRDDGFGTDFDRRDRFDRRLEEPSQQERLFRMPGQVPPGPDSGIYQPSYDRIDRQRDIDTWGVEEDAWDRRGQWDRPGTRDRGDTWGMQEDRWDGRGTQDRSGTRGTQDRWSGGRDRPSTTWERQDWPQHQPHSRDRNGW